MRTNQARKTTAAVLDMPEQAPRTRRNSDVRRAATEPLPTRRERPGAPGDPYADEDTTEFLRSRGRKRIRRGLLPQSRNGRIAAAAGLLVFLGCVASAAYLTVRFVHHDPQFTIPSSSAIELQGNQHLSRSQLLSVFGEDVDRNIFDVSLSERRDALEQIPWVQHATVMRLLPNHLRVQVTERTPVAFVRQGGVIGMADASGVLLDIPPDAPGNPNYSFPVVTGLRSEDTPESREQRMHLYTAFLKDLDSGGKKISPELSEVDLSDPEDVKALLPSNNTETLVHFGTENFLARYNRFQEHIGEWRTQYPRLNAVDMRYERQVVLQMPPKDSTVQSPQDGRADAASATTAARSAEPTSKAAKPAARQASADAPATAHADGKPASAKPAVVREVHPPRGEVHARKETPARRDTAKQADMAKRVQAIKEWMARRQQARDAAKAHTSQ